MSVPAIRHRPPAASTLERRLSAESRLASVSARPATGSVIVSFNSRETRVDEILDILETAAADTERHPPEPVVVRHPEPPGVSRFGLLRLLALTGLTLFHLLKVVVFKSPLGPRWGTALVFLGGFALFRRAFADLSRGKWLSANTFLSGAAVLASSTGEAVAALEVLWIQEVGHLLEDVIQDRSRRAIRDVILVAPKTAFRVADGAECEVPVDRIQPGDVLAVHTAEGVPVDGTVLDGHALVDESHITGRAEPELKAAGDAVYAGTRLAQGRLTVTAGKVGRDTYLANVTRMVEAALTQKTTAEKEADRLAARLLGFGLAASAATFLWTRSWAKTLSVQLALASPCATVLAASTAVTAALASAARNRVLIKGGVYLERMASVDCICFDKTGTLTEATPRIVEIVPRTPRLPSDRILSMAAAAQCHNVHPIAKALTRAAPVADSDTPSVAACETILGRGVTAERDGEILAVGNRAMMAEAGIDIRYFKKASGRLERDGCTIVYVAKNGNAQGVIGLKYGATPHAGRTVQLLRETGITEFHLISGDTDAIVANTAVELKLTDHRGNLLPEDKSGYVARLVQYGKVVAMVGDGINDAPALAQADVGIAMGAGGAEAAIEAADIALVDNRLDRLVGIRRLSRRTLRIVSQNHWFAILTDLAGAVLAISGLLPPIASGAAHIAHTAVIFANSSRLLSGPPGTIPDEMLQRNIS